MSLPSDYRLSTLQLLLLKTANRSIHSSSAHTLHALLLKTVNPRGRSRIRYPLPPPGFSESGIHLASATGKPLGFLWIHVRGFIKSAKKNLESELFSSFRVFNM